MISHSKAASTQACAGQFGRSCMTFAVRHGCWRCVQGQPRTCPHAEGTGGHDELPAPQQLKDMVVQAQKNILEVNKARLIALHELRQAKERISELGAPARKHIVQVQVQARAQRSQRVCNIVLCRGPTTLRGLGDICDTS